MTELKKSRFAVGIDLGGTFIKFALVSETGKVLYTDKLLIGTTAKQADILNTIDQAIRLTIEKANENDVTVVGIGIGSPGLCWDGIVVDGVLTNHTD